MRKQVKQWQEVLKGFSVNNRFYWIKALVKQGKLSEAEGGFLVIELGLLK